MPILYLGARSLARVVAGGRSSLGKPSLRWGYFNAANNDLINRPDGLSRNELLAGDTAGSPCGKSAAALSGSLIRHPQVPLSTRQTPLTKKVRLWKVHCVVTAQLNESLSPLTLPTKGSFLPSPSQKSGTASSCSAKPRAPASRQQPTGRTQSGYGFSCVPNSGRDLFAYLYPDLACLYRYT